jgi:diketogulonate reductase-like aldo/keto reductase
MMFLFQVFDFELSKTEVEELDALDKRSAGRRFRMDTIKGWVLEDV